MAWMATLSWPRWTSNGLNAKVARKHRRARLLPMTRRTARGRPPLSQGEAGPESILYFRVADIHAAHATLSGRGVVFLNAPHRIHGHADGTEEWLAAFNDPDGRPLAIMAQARG